MQINEVERCPPGCKPESYKNMKQQSVGKIKASECALLVCDIQERFRSLISGMPSIIDTSARMVGCLRL